MKEFSKETGNKKMWALRLSDTELHKLAECAKHHKGATRTDLIRFWINEYYDEHVKPRPARKA